MFLSCKRLSCKRLQFSHKEILEQFKNDKIKLKQGTLLLSNYMTENHTFSRDFCFCNNHLYINKLLIIYLSNLANKKIENKKLLEKFNCELQNLAKGINNKKCIVRDLYILCMNLLFFKVIEKEQIIFLLVNYIFENHINNCI